MKIKRKQQNANGVKSSTNTDKLDSKLDTDKIDFKIENKKELIKNCEIIKTDQTTNQMNKSIDKKDKMSPNGTNNCSFLNGLTNNDIKIKSPNNLVIKTDVKNQIFKEKKKSNVNKSIENNSGLNNQLNLTSNLLIDNEKIEENFNKNFISDKLTNCDKFDIKNDKINSSTNLSIDNCALNKNSFNSINNSKILELNKTTLNDNSESIKSNLSTIKKRELDSDVSNLKKKFKTNNNKNIETKDVSTSTSNASTITEPECFGFVEPGTSVVLEGAVLDEIEGVLVVNVTWRGRTFVGTLLDCTKNEWSAPRFFCDSPTSDLESRTSIFRNRTSFKRPRGTNSENENNTKLQQSKLRNGKGRRNNFSVPVSPVRNSGQTENSTNNKKGTNKSDNAIKQSTPPLDSTNCINSNLTNGNSSSNLTSSQPNQTSSQINTTNSKSQLPSQIIECPEPNCNKKYKHINGLKYHQAHHHSSNINSKSSTNNNSNKNEEINELNKDSEDATDIEDSLDEIQSNTKTNKASSNKSHKSSKKQSKENRTDSNKSPAFSDISDDTESESSRPSSNDSSSHCNMSNSQLPTINNSSAKSDEINSSTTENLNLTSNSNNLNKSLASSFPSYFLPSSPGNKNLDDSASKEDQKTNEELRKLASEVDKKISDDQKLDIGISLAPTENKLLANNSASITPNNLMNTTALTNKLIPSSNNSFFSPSFSMDPAIHAYLIQTDLNYRINYERYLVENQEKLFGTLTSNELNEIEKERHEAFLLAHQQNAALANLNNMSSINQSNNNNNKDSLFKLPSSRPASTKSNDRPLSNNSLKTTSAGGSIVNGNSLSQQNNNNNNNKNPYDFQEFEKQFEKQREETFKLNSFRLEEQRLLNSRTPMPNTHNSPSPAKKKITSNKEESNLLNNSINNNKSKQEELLKSQQQNFANNFPFLNPSSTIAPTMLSNFPSTSIVHPHFPFDPNLLANQNSSNGQIPTSLPQTFYNPLIDSLRFANTGLSPIDLNSTNNASKLLMNANQQANTHLLNSNNKKIEQAYQERNGIHRTLPNNLNQNSSTSTLLNTSNNSNISTSSKKDLDENRSPSRLNNGQHIGTAGSFPSSFIMDPFGELIQQAAASSACLISPYASK